jgi:hypothetical protein
VHLSVSDPAALGTAGAIASPKSDRYPIALPMGGQLVDPRPVPGGLRPARVRRWVVEIQIAMVEPATAVVNLALQKEQHPSQVVGDIPQVLRSLGWGRPPKRAGGLQPRTTRRGRRCSRSGGSRGPPQILWWWTTGPETTSTTHRAGGGRRGPGGQRGG